MKKLAIIGAKEFAEQITDFALQTGQFEVVGYYDNLVPKGSIVKGRPVFGTVKDVLADYQDKIFDEIFIGVGYTRFDLRQQFYEQLKGKVPFANIIMQKVFLEENVTIGEGVYIGRDCYICEGTKIEDNVFIHGGCIIAHDNKIGKHSYLSGRIDTAGFCEIGERNFVGVRALFADHVKTCSDVWIGIGCIVAKSIKNSGKYMSPSAKLYQIE